RRPCREPGPVRPRAMAPDRPLSGHGTQEPHIIAAADRTRLTGTTGNPYWYAEQLAVIPAPFRVVGGVELQHTIAGLGRRLLDAS
ncbi:MAG: hypothetical protein ACHP7G_10795, partial [Actinomycetales bacterium]